MKNISITLLLLGLAILFASCEGNTDYEWNVENASSSTIEVSVDHPFSGANNYSIAPNANEIVSFSNMLGGNPTAQEPGISFNSFFIINADGDSLQKDYTLLTHWDVIIEQVKKVPSQYTHEYTFTVTDDDF